MSAMMGELPPAMPDPEPHLAVGGGDTGGQTRGEVEVLQALLGLTGEYLSIASVEPSEAVTMKKIELDIHKLLDQNQKGQDSLTGANPALRKALAGA